jgi:dUTP pyrophosphatase
MKDNSAVLTREEIINLIHSERPLLENMTDMEAQVQPNGVDLTIKDIASIDSEGTIALDNKDRVLSRPCPIVWDPSGAIYLRPCCYLITCNEIVNIPENIMAIAHPRSSLLRCGVSVHNAVWDAGYSGRSQALMVVHNPSGFRIYKNARFIQLIFLRLSGNVKEGYKGIFQGENISSPDRGRTTEKGK